MPKENVMNLYDMSTKLNITTIPDFVRGQFMLVRLAPPKGKTIREGIVPTLAMLSYEGETGIIELIKVVKDPGGYQVTLPKGKRGILATKFRGPKSWYRFYNNVEQKFYQWGKNDLKTGVNEFLTLPYASEKLSSEVPNWEDLNDIEKEIHIDKYFEDAYMYGLAKDFNLDIEVDENEKPRIGMITDFYRRSTPPKEGERFPNVIVTKFAPREGKEPLSGDYTLVDAEIATSIYDALVRPADTSFRPEEFGKNSDGQNSDNDEFDLAA